MAETAKAPAYPKWKNRRPAPKMARLPEKKFEGDKVRIVAERLPAFDKPVTVPQKRAIYNAANAAHEEVKHAARDMRDAYDTAFQPDLPRNRMTRKQRGEATTLSYIKAEKNYDRLRRYKAMARGDKGYVPELTGTHIEEEIRKRPYDRTIAPGPSPKRRT